MTRRKIVQIDETKCDGCGLCVPSCAEGAIEIIDGKARLAADIYCDGLGACLGECPQDAIKIIEREADAFDEAAVEERLEKTAKPTPHQHTGCPSARAQSLPMAQPCACQAEGTKTETSEASPSQLTNWPIQLHLVPPGAPFLHEADLLLVADCVPFAMPNFHADLLQRKPVVIGCPKLDDANHYVEKLADIITTAKVKQITVVHMEVPCCTGLVRIAQAAIAQAGANTPLEDVTISTGGQQIG